MTEPSIRVRGIYTTALTAQLQQAEFEVVDPSPVIRERFGGVFGTGPPTTRIWSTPCRRGIGIAGEDSAVDDIADLIASEGRDTFVHRGIHPTGSIYAAEVEQTEESGAIVRLEGGTAFLPYRETAGYVETGDSLAVQVVDPYPPWSSSKRPVVSSHPRVPGTFLSLVSGTDRRISAPSTELQRLGELADPGIELPDHWGIELHEAASGQNPDALTTELHQLAEDVDAVREGFVAARTTSPSNRVSTIESLTWVRFGRESRFDLDAVRADVTPTIEGHHRLKAAGKPAASVPDYVEREEDPSLSFDAGAALRAFGPSKGSTVRIDHGKPTGETLVLGHGEVVERPRPDAIVVRRSLGAGGTLDGLDHPKEAGDVAETTFVEGKWWYPTTYRDSAGEIKGRYCNVGTPIEILSNRVQYVDLYVDVVATSDGIVETLDRQELADAVSEGNVAPTLAERARTVAASIKEAL